MQMSIINKFMNEPGKSHITTAKKILKYIQKNHEALHTISS